MSQHFQFIVVGRGMMGAAAARHLALQTGNVALIGPDEPEDKQRHTGVFGSHYDEGRITRTIDPDADWAMLANRSIARYAEIARESGIEFYRQVGCLLVGPKRGGHDSYIGDVLAAAQAVGAQTHVVDDAALAEHFPYFSFPGGSEGVFEPGIAGYISPRRLVKAQTALAAKAKAVILPEVVVSVRDSGGVAIVTTSSGQSYTADKVLVATGGFSIADGLLPDRIALNVYARTITFFEVDDAEALRLAAMPSLITKPEVERDSIYMLPAIRYPDGKSYLKIGGDPDDMRLETEAEVRDWFRTDGRASTRDHLVRVMGNLIPDLKYKEITTGACVTSFTPGEYPAIGYTSSSRIAVVTGGCGKAAKSSDEIGRLGAELLLEGRIVDAAYAADFTPVFL